MNFVITLGLLAAFVAAAQAACCPQPANARKCDCCPAACCCMCKDVTVPGTPCALKGFDMLFIVDRSASIGSAGWAEIMGTISDFLGQFTGVGTAIRVAFVSYDGLNATLVWNLDGTQTDSLATLQSSFINAPFQASFTNAAAGLWFGSVFVFNDMGGDRPDADYPDVAFYISDGKANIDKDLVPQRAQELKDATALVQSISVRTAVANFTELDIIADGSNQENVETIETLMTVQGQVALKNKIESLLTTIVCPQGTDTPSTTVEVCNCCCPPLPRQEAGCACTAGSSMTG